LFLLLINVIGISQSFGVVNIMTQGGPGTSTDVLSYHIYQEAFQYNEFGYAAAAAVLTFLAAMLFAGVLWVATRRHVFYR
jgi:multiple sugar transport system permease protein